MHLAPLCAIWTGTKWQDWAACLVLYWGRMFFVSAAYHRYFSHRTYKTSRPFQFLLAFGAETSSQKGVLWWAAQHRTHHRYSDTELDPHNSLRGFWYSHLGWLFDHTEQTDFRRVRDLAKYPELVLLQKLWVVPPTLLGVLVWWLLGWSGLWIGFALSTALLWHGTFTVNSLSHLFGSQRYETGDQSRNNWLLTSVTLGECWHNNHHRWMQSTRQGFFWWEVDVSYYILRLFAALGLVWDLNQPPAHLYQPDSFLKGGKSVASEPQLIPPTSSKPTNARAA
jgi:stearoyl-CoA desaturase (delta-9 desaturase)